MLPGQVDQHLGFFERLGKRFLDDDVLSGAQRLFAERRVQWQREGKNDRLGVNISQRIFESR